MDSKKFPPEMTAAIKASKIASWVNHGGDFTTCPNCGGWGFFSLVTALSGPFNHPSNYGSTSSDKINGNTVWYSTITNTYTCPVCKGNKYYKDEQQRPIHQPVIQLEKEWTDF